jgi:hypothetical protein
VSTAWNEYCGHTYAATHPAPEPDVWEPPAWLNSHHNAAIEPVGDVFEALGAAERLAWEAMLAGRIRYSDWLGWAERDLLENWLFYCRCTRIGGVALKAARKLLRMQIRLHRLLREQERTGIIGRLGAAA